MRFSKIITSTFLPLLILGISSESAHARLPIPQRRPLWMGGQGSKCPQDFPKPPVCDIPDSNYKSSNGPNGKHLFKALCDQIKAQVSKSPKCILVVGYRSCKFNSNTRGAARNSRHLCGKAADLRKGSCGALGATHLKGTAAHQHLANAGTCR